MQKNLVVHVDIMQTVSEEERPELHVVVKGLYKYSLNDKAKLKVVPKILVIIDCKFNFKEHEIYVQSCIQVRS